MGGGGNPAMAPPKVQEGGAIMSFAPQSSQKAFIFYCSFFKSEFGSIQKNNGLNPLSFEFWRYPRLEPRAKLHPPPPKTGGWTGLEK